MSNEKILRKIKRCLALSQSSNIDEASTALRQAQKLMQKHNITENDTLSLDINQTEIKATTKSKPPVWQYNLASVIAKTMGCEYHCRRYKKGAFGHSVFVFLGFDYQSEIASYAFEVLLRQLMQERKAFVKSLSNSYSRTEKKQLGDNYCMGWVLGVNEVVQEFQFSQAQKQALKRYHQSKHNATTLRDGLVLPTPQGYQKALMQGIENGRQAKLHRGTAHNATARLC